MENHTEVPSSTVPATTDGAPGVESPIPAAGAPAVVVQPQLPGVWPPPSFIGDPLDLVTYFDHVAAARQRRQVGRADSLEHVTDIFESLDLETRIAVAVASMSVLHVVEVFAQDRSAVVRAACARNRNSIDVRLQWQLVRDDDPMVVLALLEAADLDVDILEWLIDEYDWDVARYRLAHKPLARRFLERLAVDPSPRVAALAAERIASRWPALASVAVLPARCEGTFPEAA